ELGGPADESMAKDLLPNLPGKHLREQRGHGVAHLLLDGRSPSLDHHVVGKGLQTTELAHAEPPVLPVERTGRGSWLSLEGPRGLVLGELQQEAPEAAPPAEQGSTAAAFGVPQIVLTLR